MNDVMGERINISVYTGSKTRKLSEKEEVFDWGYNILIDEILCRYDTDYEYDASIDRMDMMAIIEALQWLLDKKSQNKNINLYSKSKKIIRIINNGKLIDWKNNNWENTQGKEIEGLVLWEEIYDLINQFSHLNFLMMDKNVNNPMTISLDKFLNRVLNKL